ncbi:MAG TPA: bifunctional serine/threonine-protein kinase/formylglycine-generating enzyme family protein [Polyangiaceae bacterium]|nr:bifunctional serine/threonine-protein kinase/formylglycine-generating enzyme family protein [Polyangiaceae bacterium]
MRLEPGALVNPRVRLVEPIAEGAMGTVWLAEHLTLECEVAVKFISTDLLHTDDPQVLDRFETEAKAAAQIRSPHVVQILDFGTTDGVPYIVMERLVGSSLADWLELSGRLGIVETTIVVGQVARALAKAHQLGIIHRDIKPHNIFLMGEETSYDGEGPLVKVLDFGIAKRGELPEGVTLPGTVVGTPEYMCPDQLLESRDVDHQADLWSLSVVTYQALTGEIPFVGNSVAALFGALLRREYPPPSSLRPELPGAVDVFFQRAFAEAARDRFSDAAELATALREAVLSPQRRASPPPSEDVTPVPTSEGMRSAPPPRGVIASLHDVARASFHSLADHMKGPEGRVRAVLAASAGIGLGVALAVFVHARDPQAVPKAAAPAVASVDVAPRRVEGDKALPPFRIDRTEVTVAQYRACATEGDCTVEGLTSELVGCNWAAGGRDDHPINCVSWPQAVTYCRWAGGALPSEAQWERAARGSDGRMHPWGGEQPSCALAVMRDATEGPSCGRSGTWSVGSRLGGVSPAGAVDMAGNVREWVADQKKDGGAEQRSVRGGGFNDDAGALRATARQHLPPETRAADLGFRCAYEGD